VEIFVLERYDEQLNLDIANPFRKKNFLFLVEWKDAVRKIEVLSWKEKNK
jgi:hypothetical protein